MTGQVKEDILSRFGELGIYVENGKLCFYPCLLRKKEFVENDKPFTYINLYGEKKTIQLKKGSLGFTYCQVPVIYQIAEENMLEVHLEGSKKTYDKLAIDQEISKEIFKRTGKVHHIKAYVAKHQLK